MRIGILSDTHLTGRTSLDDLGPEAATFLSSVDLILHGGDVVRPSHLDWYKQFAPLLCARGNNDDFDDPRMVPVVLNEQLGWRIGVVHQLRGIAPNTSLREVKERAYGDRSLEILVTGDSHYERLEYEDGTLLIDSASPNLPHHKSTRLGSMALLELTRDGVRAELVPLGDTPGLPNPVTAAHVEFDRGGLLAASLSGTRVDTPDGRFAWRGAGVRRADQSRAS
jgi:putative phosphoesterase